MSANDLIILKQTLQQIKAQTYPHLPDSKFFEVFATEQLLKDFNLSNDEIETGLTGGGNDGGIDGMYTFVNGKLLFEELDPSSYRKGVAIELFIIQSKRSEGFEGASLDKITVTVKDIFDLQRGLDSLENVYDSKLLQATYFFRKATEELASKFPKMKITIAYASLGDTEQIHPNVQRKANNLEMDVKDLFLHSTFEFLFYGSRELLHLARKTPSNTLQVNLFDYIAGNQAYLCLINVKDYYNFISEGNGGNLRKYIFEANVRDYQGKVEVNLGIRDTLKEDPSEDFWWLNNGVTIIAAAASISGKTMTLEDPQIVNGLQTSTEIYEHFSNQPNLYETRSILVKIVITTRPDSQDRIIRATNSQTAIPLASLKATDKVQRDIEDYFRTNDLFYDRRKNYYKNLGVQRDKIISISYLAQAVMTMVLREPNEARARPSSILKRDSAYKQIFNAAYPMKLYLNCALLMKLVDEFIKSDKSSSPTEEKNNLRFHYALYITLNLKNNVADKREKVIRDLTEIFPKNINEETLIKHWEELVIIFREYRKTHSAINADAIGKSKEFVEVILRKFD